MIDMVLVLLFGLSSILGAMHRRLGYYSIMAVSAAFLVNTALDLTYTGYFSMIASTVWILVSFFSISYGERYGKWLSSMLALTIMGMSLILVSDNYLYLIVGWEVMSVPSYVIIGLNKSDSRPPFIFMMFSEISTIFIITGAAYAFVVTGTLAFQSVSSYVPMLLLSVGALVKMGMSPFMISEWLPIAHGNAPSNASAVLSSTMTLMGVYLIVRMMLISPHQAYVGLFFLIVGAISILFAAMYAYVSENMKMLAGFSTVDNNAAILAGAGLYLVVSSPTLQVFILDTILIMSLAHSVAKSGLFMSIGNTDGEFFSQIRAKSNSLNNIGTFLSTMSLSGLLPTIGGLGVWMLLEAFFMEAYTGGFTGIISIVVGSVIALGEGLATGAMLKVLAFGSLFHRPREMRHDTGAYAVLATGAVLVALFAVSTLMVNSAYIGGLPSVAVFNGFTILSKFTGVDFGLISPGYIIVLVGIFTVAAYYLFGKPRSRPAPVWNGGRKLNEVYTSYAYSNNIKLMLSKILRTRVTRSGQHVSIVDVFWAAMTGTGIAYRKMCRFVTLKIMNSSIGWYMVYMMAAFLGTLLIFAFAYS
ncbi:hypothetical protein IX51_01260 [uncultured archaeon]|nr:hypothetical protein IX51_01260 [uncultured archaeon]